MTMTPLGEIAPISRRIIAYLIDALLAAVLPIIGIIVVATMTVGALRNPEAAASAGLGIVAVALVVGVLSVAWFVVYTVMQTGAGSIGMRAQGLRLTDAAGAGRLSFGRALLRNLVFGVTGAVVIGMFSPLFDGSGRFQGWHDKAANAVMRDARSVAPAADAEVPAVEPFASLAAAPPTAAISAAPPPSSMSSPALDVNELPEQTVAAARPPAAAPADPLISFVPGVTRADHVPEPTAAPASAPPVAAAASTPAPATPAVPAPAPVPPAPAPATLVDSGDEDDIEATRISIPGHRLVFTWDDGQRVPVSGRTVFGRNPEREPGAIVIAVRDETLSLSKTHFEAAAEPTGGWIMDRRSTNGTVVVREGVRIACPPGQRIPVRLGDAIEIGDRIVTIGGFA
ncbi:RDD family protein [Microbacterium sp. USHLN186]|uniref:RDD family protein n=1 Tax=Microbacterium sp. USHLN186 TaxID=3081286 RepID=UPI0030165F16